MMPSAGRIVIFHQDDDEYLKYARNGGRVLGRAPRTHPAIITSVGEDGTVNLMVMFDGGDAEARIAVRGIDGEYPNKRGWTWPELILPIDDSRAGAKRARAKRAGAKPA